MVTSRSRPAIRVSPAPAAAACSCTAPRQTSGRSSPINPDPVTNTGKGAAMKTKATLCCAALTALLATASLPVMARPMILQPKQVILSPAPQYHDFGLVSVAMDGDWALITANNAPPSPSTLDYDDHGLLYRRVN